MTASKAVDVKSVSSPFAAADGGEAPVKYAAETADDVMIRRAFTVGDFKTCVARCLATNRMADALMFALYVNVDGPYRIAITPSHHHTITPSHHRN